MFVKKIKNKITLIVLCSFLFSCGAGKIVTGSATANGSFSSKDIIKTHHTKTPIFNTLAARVHVDYNNGKDSQSLTVSLRMEKDKKIWIKASILGITLAKVLITPDKVQYYEKIGGTYFDGDFSLLSNWLGTEIDFEKAQNILLGQAIFDLPNWPYNSEIVNNEYKLTPQKEYDLFLHFLTLKPDTFKIASEDVIQQNEGRRFQVFYGDYQHIEKQIFPKDISIKASENERLTEIDIDFRKIDLNVSVKFPFTIPQGYDELILEN